MIGRDPVEPSGKLRVESKPADALERQKKDFLGRLARLIRITQHSQREVVNRPLPFQNEPVEGHRIAALAGRNPGSFLRSLGVLGDEGSSMRQGRIQNVFHPSENVPQGRSTCLTPYLDSRSLKIVEDSFDPQDLDKSLGVSLETLLLPAKFTLQSNLKQLSLSRFRGAWPKV